MSTGARSLTIGKENRFTRIGREAGVSVSSFVPTILNRLAGCPGLRTTLLAFLGSRALIALIAFFAVHGMPVREGNHQATGVVEAFMRWDSAWYLDIARNGYTFDPNQQSPVVFLPGFPLLTHVGSLGFLPLKYGGLIASNLCLLIAGVLLWRLFRLDSDERTANGSLRFLFFGPVSFFFSIVYSEGAFLCFAIAALYGARTRRWWLAGLAGYAAALTRSVGLLLVIPLVIEFWQQERHRFSFRSFRSWIALACAGLPGAGTLTYMLYMAILFGDPLVYRKAEIHWGRVLSPFWELFTLQNTETLPLFYVVWFYGALAVGVILTALGIGFKLRPSYLAMCGAYLLLYTSTSLLEAMPRYLSIVVPLYFVLGRLIAWKPSLEVPLTVLSCCLLTFSTVMFTTGYWFT